MGRDGAVTVALVLAAVFDAGTVVGIDGTVAALPVAADGAALDCFHLLPGRTQMHDCPGETETETSWAGMTWACCWVLWPIVLQQINA